MITCFWSPFGGSGVTTATVSVGLLQSRTRGSRIAVFSTKYDYNDIVDFSVDYDYTSSGNQRGGIDDLLAKCGNSNYSYDELYTSAVDVGGTSEIGLSLFLGSRSADKSKFLTDLSLKIAPILTNLRAEYTQVNVDLGSGLDEITLKAISMTDRLVICLPQNKIKVSKFISKFPGILPKDRCIFVMSQFNPKNKFTLGAFRKLCSSAIPNVQCVTLTDTININNAINTNSLKSVIYSYSKKSSNADGDSAMFIKEIRILIDILKKRRKADALE